MSYKKENRDPTDAEKMQAFNQGMMDIRDRLMAYDRSGTILDVHYASGALIVTIDMLRVMCGRNVTGKIVESSLENVEMKLKKNAANLDCGGGEE